MSSDCAAAPDRKLPPLETSASKPYNMPTTSLLRDNIARFPMIREFHFFDKFYSSTVLPFTMELQVNSNWCWAATSKSVSYFYCTSSPWTQCKIASDELGLSCCNSPLPGGCNVPWYLDRALTRTNNFVQIQSGTIDWQEIKDQLDRGLVIGARVGWNGGGGHFMVIYGVSRIAFREYVHIDDPIYGKNTMTYTEFATNYQGAGTWTHTYFTKKYHYHMWLRDLVFNPKLLSPIPEVRPLARMHDGFPSILSNLKEPEYASAHNNYIMGLNEIHGELRLPERPMSLRVLEFEEDEPVAMYEVALNEEQPGLIQLNSNKNYFKNFESALEALKRSGREQDQAELRSIRIPALNLEAAWLHYDDVQNDRFVMLNNFPNLNGVKNKAMTESEFREYLMKQKERMGEMNELMGA